MKMKSIWLAEEDEAAIATIRTRYGVDSESAAIRLALRTLAASPLLQIQPLPRPKHARRGKPLAGPALADPATHAGGKELDGA